MDMDLALIFSFVTAMFLITSVTRIVLKTIEKRSISSTPASDLGAIDFGRAAVHDEAAGGAGAGAAAAMKSTARDVWQGGRY